MLSISAELENLTNLQPRGGCDDPNYRYYFKVHLDPSLSSAESRVLLFLILGFLTRYCDSIRSSARTVARSARRRPASRCPRPFLSPVEGRLRISYRRYRSVVSLIDRSIQSQFLISCEIIYLFSFFLKREFIDFFFLIFAGLLINCFYIVFYLVEVILIFLL